MSTISLRLSESDVALCRQIAEQRIAVKYGESDEYRDADTKAVNNHVGAVGEFVVAKLLGTLVYDDWLANRAFFTGQHAEHPADCGHAVQVKTVDKSHLNLVVPQYDGDKRRHVFVLVCWNAADRLATVLGWARGHDFMIREYWVAQPNNHRSYWRYPQQLLAPFATLPPEYVHGP